MIEIDLQETTISAYIVINAMKFMLEEEGSRIEETQISLSKKTKNGRKVSSSYNLNEMIGKVIKELQIVLKSNGTENVHIACGRTKEKLEAKNQKEMINSSSALKTKKRKTRVEVVNLLSEEDIQSFNKNFYPNL